MLEFVSLDSMDVSWCLILFVQVIEAPDILQIVLSHELVGILCRLLDLVKYLDILNIKLWNAKTDSHSIQQRQIVVCITEEASLLVSWTSLVLESNLLQLSCLFLCDLYLAAKRFTKLVEAVGYDHFKVIQLSVYYMMRR